MDIVKFEKIGYEEPTDEPTTDIFAEYSGLICESFVKWCINKFTSGGFVVKNENCIERKV